jgi:flagellar biosynthesis chaperone FliJ
VNRKLKKSMEKLTNMDLYHNEDVRNTYIDHIVSKLKRGVYPTTSLNRVKSLIVKHNKIVEAKKNLKRRG